MSVLKYSIFIFLFFVSASIGLAKTISMVAVSGYQNVIAYKEIVEFVKAAIEDSGLQVKIVELPRGRGAYAVNNADYDALPFRGLEDAKSLPNVITSKFPVAFTVFRLVSLNKNKKFLETKMKDFSGAMVLNNSSLQDEAAKRKIQVAEFNVGYPDLVKMLSAGRVDYILAPEEIVASIIDQDPSLKSSLKVSDSIFVKTPLYFSMHRRNRVLMPRIEKSLRKFLKGDLSKYKYIRNSLNRNLEEL